MGGASQTRRQEFSHREIEILNLITEGLSNREISQKLFLSLETVKWYNKQLFSKLGASNRVQAIKLAQANALFHSYFEKPGKESDFSLGTLPSPVNTYVGREEDIQQIIQFLSLSRLVVLTGPGGIGKTRLAVQVAQSIAGTFSQGAWFIDLAPLSNSDRVLEAAARVLKVVSNGKASLLETLKHFLARKHLLLIFDNFEHVLGAAQTIATLLSAAPRLHILVTSREKLRLYGEVEYPVRPLRLPDRRLREILQNILSSEAVTLFMQRAQAARPGLQPLDPENIMAAARICARLDGMPLAIELAASQVKYTSPLRLAQRLERSLGELPEGPRDLPARQRTLHESIQWSYDLLQADEKRLLNRMAVFHGSCTLDAIQAVSSAGISSDLPTLVTSLCDKSLIAALEGPDGEPHFRMLETIREFAERHLRAGGEMEQAQELHARYYLSLSEQFREQIRSPRHTYWNARMQAEENNLMAALDWAFSGKNILLGLNLFTNLDQYWDINGGTKDAHWFAAALEHRHFAPLGMQASILNVAGLFYTRILDSQRATVLLQEAIEISQRLGDPYTAAWSFLYLVPNLSQTPEGAQSCIQQLQAVLETFHSHHDRPGIAVTLTALGESYRLLGNDEAAYAHYDQSLATAREIGDRFRQAINLSNMSFACAHLRRYEKALELGQKALAIIKELDMGNNATFLFSLAGPLAALGKPEQAAILLGAAQAAMELSGADVQPADKLDAEAMSAAIRSACGEAAYLSAWQTGYHMPVPELYTRFLPPSISAL